MSIRVGKTPPVAREQTFVNARVFTGRSEHEFASAFRISDGRFTWVGDRVGERGGEGGGDRSGVDVAEVIDLGGRIVLPGFIDAHTHPPGVARNLRAIACTPPDVNSIPQLIAALRRHPNFGRGPDAWIEGWGYDESKLAEHRAPTARDLDQVSATQPVFVSRSDCHSGACNTRALALAGITRDTPDPPGAAFGRWEGGEPNGLLHEFAASFRVQDAKGLRDYAAVVAELAATGAHFSQRGIVAASDMLATLAPHHALQLYRDAAAQGLRQQVPLYFEWADLLKHGVPDLSDAERTGRAKFAGVKLFADGTVSGRTAWLSAPYPARRETGTHDPGMRDSGARDHGTRLLDDQTLRAACAWARRNRVQLAVHAMGDAAIQQVIDVLAGEEPWMAGGLPSVRIEHATLLSRGQIDQMNRAAMRFGATTQVIFLFAEHESYSGNLSAEQFAAAYPLRTCYERFERLCLSSDAPSTTWNDPDNVFDSIQAAVTRRAYNGADINGGQALTVAQAVLMHTARAARVAPYEGSLGRIAPGGEASFVVLDRDIFSIAPDEIGRTRVAQTWIQGRPAFAGDG